MSITHRPKHQQLNKPQDSHCDNLAEQQQHFDVIISGGGLSGCLMALSLCQLAYFQQTNGQAKNTQRSGLKIAIVEANQINHDFSSTFDSRVLALSHASVEYLKQLAVWPSIALFAQPIENIHISDRGHYGKARMSADDYHVNALGYVVEMSVLGSALFKALETYTVDQTKAASLSTSANASITWFSPDSIEAITWHKHKVEVSLSSKQCISAGLLLGCDGANSVCRQAANIAIESRDYQQSAIIANVSVAKPHNNLAFERFTEYGPIAMLPLTNHGNSTEEHGQSRCSLVWTLPPQLAEQVVNYDDKAFIQALTTAFGTWLGAVTFAGKRDIYPLKLIKAEQNTYHRMALIGNASHTIHPIAGQGFNLGLRDVQQLTQIFAQTLNQQIAEQKAGQKAGHSTEQSAESNGYNIDFGQFEILAQYEHLRASDQHNIINLTDSLVTLFSNALPPMIAGRNIGLKLLNYCSPLKQALAKKTMGY